MHRYRILATDDPNYVMIDLEFDSPSEAEAVQDALHGVYGRIDVTHSPQTRIGEAVEIKE